MSLLPGEQEALQQSAIAGGPEAKIRTKTTSHTAGGPIAMSTPASLKSSKKKQTQPVN